MFLNVPSSFYAFSILVVTYAYWSFVFVEIKATRQRVRAVAARKKEEYKKTKAGESSSAPKTIKEAAKRKNDEKDDRPSKKVSVTARGKPSKKSSPKKHGAGKGLMTTDPVTQDFECRLLTYKSYAVEMLESIIKDKDVDPYVGQATKELGDSGLFDLAWVSTFHPFISSFSC